MPWAWAWKPVLEGATGPLSTLNDWLISFLGGSGFDGREPHDLVHLKTRGARCALESDVSVAGVTSAWIC